MKVTLVYVEVKPEHIAAFIEATRLNHEGARQESGNLRFDLVQDADNPAKFVIYEAYQSAQDILAHKQTEHYLTWRTCVEPWMAQPRMGVPYIGLLPKAGPVR